MSAFTDTLVAELERVKSENQRLRSSRAHYKERARTLSRVVACRRVSLVCGCGRTVTGIPRVSTRKSNERTPNPLVGAGVRSEGA